MFFFPSSFVLASTPPTLVQNLAFLSPLRKLTLFFLPRAFPTLLAGVAWMGEGFVCNKGVHPACTLPVACVTEKVHA